MCTSVRQSSRLSAPKELRSTKSIHFILETYSKFHKHILILDKLEKGWWKTSLQICIWRELCSGLRDGKRKHVLLGRPMEQVFPQRCQFEGSSQLSWQIIKYVFYFFSQLYRAFWLFQSFITPTNAQLICFKTLQFTLKYITIAPTCFGFD